METTRISRKLALHSVTLTLLSTCFALGNTFLSPASAIETKKDIKKVLRFDEQGKNFLLPPPEFRLRVPRKPKQNGGNVSSLGAAAESMTAPMTAPTNFLTTGQNQQITLTWDSVAGATGYNLWRSTGNGYSYITTVGNVNSYVDGNLLNGTRYDYAINAITAAGSSPDFAYASGTPYDPFAPYPYTSFDGYNLPRYLWMGQKVVLLTSSNTLNPSSTGKILSALDTAYNYYSATTGRTPSLFRHIDGRTTVAEAPSTCNGMGAGCGYLGATGIELQTDYFNVLYNEVTNNNLYDQVPFYELGRNFWFYSDKIEYIGSDNTGAITTGFAVYMRSKSMEAANVAGAPLNGFPFNSFKTEIASLVDRYEADPALNWNNTLKIGLAPANSMNLSGPDLFASFCQRLERDYGGEAFVQKLWKEVDKQPVATTTTEALNNFVRAASNAAGQDLTSLFQNRWRWPLTNKPMAVADSFTVKEDTATSLNTLANDWDAYGDPLSILSVTQGARGSVTKTNDAVVYTPQENYNGPDSFTYTVVDSRGATATATVNVTVSAVNDAPVAASQSVSLNANTTKTILLAASDIDRDALTYSVVAAPSQGRLSGSAPNLTYTPNPNFSGSDSFTFRANDGTANSNTATISISVASVTGGYKARFYPRNGWATRMTGGKFQGSNTSSTSGYVDLVTLSTTPLENAWSESNLGSTAYRYYRYLSPNGGWGNVAEVEFYHGSTKLTGIGFGSSGSWSGTSSDTHDKAQDGNVQTFYDANTSDGAYTGLDTGTNTETPTGSGSITREVWNNVSGTALTAIPVNTAPSSTSTLTSFEAPVDVADNYGQRVRGYLTAPTTGSYTFWIAGDDQVELRLSTNDQVSTRVIASHNSWTNSREWNKFANQKSEAISLTAGQRYYIEALMKEGEGGDNLAVGWAKPGQETTAPSEVIPGSALSPYSSVTNAKLAGTVIGTTGSWDGMSTRDKVFDGSLNTFFDAPTSQAWTGLDLGSAKTITQVKFAPRSGWSARMVGGKFQGSNTADFSSGVTDLHTVSGLPAQDSFTTQNINVSGTFRYVRYLSPVDGWGNIAEAEFWGN